MSNLPFALATDPDFVLDQLRDTSPCPTCKSPDPARLGYDHSGTNGCSDCLTFRTCFICKRWTGEEYGVFVHNVTFEGRVEGCCENCWDRQDVMVPLDMTEGDDDDDQG